MVARGRGGWEKTTTLRRRHAGSTGTVCGSTWYGAGVFSNGAAVQQAAFGRRWHRAWITAAESQWKLHEKDGHNRTRRWRQHGLTTTNPALQYLQWGWLVRVLREGSEFSVPTNFM